MFSTSWTPCVASSSSRVRTIRRPMTRPSSTQNVCRSIPSPSPLYTVAPFPLSYQYRCAGLTAVSQIFQVIEEQSQGSFDADFNFISYYNWTGGNGALSPAVNNGGNGEPKAYTGLVGTHHRPSDDLSTFGWYLHFLVWPSSFDGVSSSPTQLS